MQIGKDVRGDGRDPVDGALHRFGLDDQHLAGQQPDGAVLHRAGADLGAAEILEHGHRFFPGLFRLAHRQQGGLVRCVGAVREVEAGHIHPGKNHFAEYFRRVACRADGADNLGFFIDAGVGLARDAGQLLEQGIEIKGFGEHPQDIGVVVQPFEDLPVVMR